jgi:hypothetical protein
LTAIRITDGGLKKLISEAPASHSREQAGNHHSWSEPSGCGLTPGVMKKIKGGENMIMTNAMRAELELMQLCLEGSEENKIEIALEILARILK